ncbi:catalase [Bradyrhizobium sp. SRL28]|uniref:catalase n=1 Tax=Bradyrhizobium sp. SRL28 TaxID=2836178 RepID=UPI001BDED459|nr:catalase [Bradyrhizobium sp. SRL28]MBT1515104.1 catalase [Bradyrhizobium sp. SRL28]
MVDASVARRLVDEMIFNLPKHDPGQRPVHTIGVGVDAYFTASDVAHKYCIAEHFSGERICAKVRFSNAPGGPEQHDGRSDVRGMATRFLLPSGAATDLIATTLREFFARDVDDFSKFTKLDKHEPYQRESPWRKILDLLWLKVPRRDPYPGEKTNASAGILSYANQHRFAQLAVFEAKMIGAPVSYVRAAYHAIHTFIVEGENGVRRPVRFSWQPVAGVRNTDPDALPDDDYLRQELDHRLKRWPVRFVLMMTIGEAGDAIDDPTRPWPARRVRVIMGTLTLTGVPKDQATAGERISFNPWRLVRGIEPSGDPILRARRDAYEVSRKMRGGTACPFSNWSCADGE